MKRLSIMALLLGPFVMMACNVPVFRYALERWRPSSYEVLVFHRGALPSEVREVAATLKDISLTGNNLANLSLTIVDLSVADNERGAILWADQPHATLPWIAVRAPGSKDGQPAVWSGPLSSETVQALARSPARQEIADRLLNGDSAVWLLLESGNSTADEAAFQMLDRALKQAEQSIELPVPDPSDPRMRAELPLRIAFSSLRVARDDPTEGFLLATLRHHQPALANQGLPVAVPIFGRGRVLAVLPGESLTPTLINEACRFIAGPCSCQVKEQNPGFDLLITADWEALLDRRRVNDPELPPLVGLSEVAAINLPPPPDSSSPASAATPFAGRLMRNLWFVFGVGIAFSGFATLFLMAQAAKPKQ